MQFRKYSPKEKEKEKKERKRRRKKINVIQSKMFTIMKHAIQKIQPKRKRQREEREKEKKKENKCETK